VIHQAQLVFGRAASWAFMDTPSKTPRDHAAGWRGSLFNWPLGSLFSLPLPLVRVATHPASKIDELLPMNWAKRFAVTNAS
jgi:hypothetical protein